MSDLQPIDLLCFAILGIAALRGLFLGLIREAFSIGALAAAVVVVRLVNPSVGPWLSGASGGGLGETAAAWVSGVLLAVAAIAVVGTIGSVVRRGARAVGLGWADRLGGAALGMAEGVIVSGVLLVVLGAVLGRDHTLVAGSHSLTALESLEQTTGRSVPAVAAPPPQSN